MLKEIKAALARGVPITFIRTLDQVQVLRDLAREVNGGRSVLIHDVCRGFTPGNEKSREILPSIIEDADPSLFTDPVTALGALKKAPKGSVIVCLGADRWLDKPMAAMGALLLRDSFKANGCMLVCLGLEYFPANELGADMHVIEDPPPGLVERTVIVRQISSDSGCKLTPEIEASLLTYTRGLSSFACEQTCALAVGKEGFDLRVAEKTWIEQINSTPGLRVLTDRPDPKMVTGLSGLTEHVQRLTKARKKPEVIVFIDEIEKALAGSSGAGQDSSGASQAILGKTLTYMETSNASGCVCYGPPGTGKSLVACVAGVILGVPTIQFDPGNCKGSLVGETEKNIARALRVLEAIGGQAYVFATCNGMANLPPELIRRFRDGTFFFDLPSREERDSIWKVHLSARKLSDEPYANDENWTGADIRNVCEQAWNLNCPVDEIARIYVPSSRAIMPMIDRMRQSAINCYRSAQYPGAYKGKQVQAQEEVSPRRFEKGGN